MNKKLTNAEVEALLRRIPARGIHPSAIGNGAVAGHVLTLGADLVAEWAAAASGGVTDHGALTGLADDDHTQYHNDARGDARYWQLSTDLATQAELDAHVNDTTDAHDASAISILDTAGDFTATDVEGALAELQADADADATALSDHLADAVGAHAASAISVDSTTLIGTATTVQGALDEIDDVANLATNNLSVHILDTANAHDGSAITNYPAGNIVATDVQAAINELDSDKVAFTNKIHELAVPTAATPMNGQKFTGLGAGSADGDSLRYEQLFKLTEVTLLAGLYSPQSVQASSLEQGLGVNPSVFINSGYVAGYAARGDSNPKYSLTLTNGLEFGAGGASARDWKMSRTAADIVALGSGDKLQQNAAPTTGDDLTNKTYVDAEIAASGGGVPAGGVADEIITKIDATDGNVEWSSYPIVRDTVAPSDSRTLWIDTSSDPDNQTFVQHPSNIAAGQAVLWTGSSWIPYSMATQQSLDDLRDEFEGHHHDDRYPRVSCRAQPTANSAAWPGGAWTFVYMDGEAHDTHAMHDNVTNSHLVRAPFGGVYMVSAACSIGTGAGAVYTACRIVRRNAAGVDQEYVMYEEEYRPAMAATSYRCVLNGATAVYCAPGDTFHMELFIDVASTYHVYGLSTFALTHLDVTMIR